MVIPDIEKLRGMSVSNLRWLYDVLNQPNRDISQVYPNPVAPFGAFLYFGRELEEKKTTMNLIRDIINEKLIEENK